MSRVSRLEEELVAERENLKLYEEARIRIVMGGQSYSIQNGDDKRQVENVSLSQLNTLIEKTKARIDHLEYRIAHNGSTGKSCIVGGRL